MLSAWSLLEKHPWTKTQDTAPVPELQNGGEWGPGSCAAACIQHLRGPLAPSPKQQNVHSHNHKPVLEICPKAAPMSLCLVTHPYLLAALHRKKDLP